MKLYKYHLIGITAPIWFYVVANNSTEVTEVAERNAKRLVCIVGTVKYVTDAVFVFPEKP